MGLFDFLKRKKEPEVKQATPAPPPPKAAEPSLPLDVSWSVWPAKVEDVAAELAREHAFARAHGLRMIVYSYEAWSPGSVAFKKFRMHPLAKTVLRNVHVVEFGMGVMDKLNEMGVRAMYIPQLWAFDKEGKIAGKSISGAYWGEDTPENIARALPLWFQELEQTGH